MLTARQKALLNAIISEFIDTAQAVGSIDLPDKYELDVSPATIRNEMARLMQMGYLDKPHASSGRIPTTMAFRLFLDDLMNEVVQVEYKKQVALEEEMFQKRYNLDQLVLTAVRTLNEITDNTAIALIDDKIYHVGLKQLLKDPEFQDLNKLRRVLSIVEDYAELANIFSRNTNTGQVQILIGDELGYEDLTDCAFVFSKIPTYSGRTGYLAIIGPNRLDYRKTIPALKYISDKIQSMLNNWK